MLADNNDDEKSADIAENKSDNDSKDEMLSQTMSNGTDERSDQDEKHLDFDQDDEPYEIKSVNVEDADKGVAAETSAILDNVMSDKDKIICISGAILFIIGSYLNFWSVYTKDLGILNQGNLFGGYLLAGMLGKACVILAIVYMVMIFFDKTIIYWYMVIALTAVYIIQVLLILILGSRVLGAAANGVVVPGVGFFVCVICVGVDLIFTRKLYKKGK